MALATLDQLKTHMKITTTSQDAQLTQILAGAIAFVKAGAEACGIKLETETITETLDGRNSHRLFLSFRPANSVTSLHISASQTWDATTLLDTTKYRLYARQGLIKRSDGEVFAEGFQNVQAIYSAGYLTAPSDLTLGILCLASQVAGQAGKESLVSEEIGDYSYTMATAQKDDRTWQLLAPYIERMVPL